jgi:hypothetical protein
MIPGDIRGIMGGATGWHRGQEPPWMNEKVLQGLRPRETARGRSEGGGRESALSFKYTRRKPLFLLLRARNSDIGSEFVILLGDCTSTSICVHLCACQYTQTHPRCSSCSSDLLRTADRLSGGPRHLEYRAFTTWTSSGSVGQAEESEEEDRRANRLQTDRPYPCLLRSACIMLRLDIPMNDRSPVDVSEPG